MNKILRISMIAVLALIANFSFAGVSTIDFTKLSVKTVSDVDNKENNGYTFTSGDFTFTAKKIRVKLHQPKMPTPKTYDTMPRTALPLAVLK